MFAEQPSVKLCCQLCCSVFKDPVITTCGVRPPVPSPTSAPPWGWVGCRPLPCGAWTLVTGMVWSPNRCPLQWASGGGDCGHAPS